MTDLKSFVFEIEEFINEDDIVQLETKAGIRFPINNLEWADLCYICCWLAMTKKLPDNLHNRMVLGEKNDWTEIYAKAYKHYVYDTFVLAS